MIKSGLTMVLLIGVLTCALSTQFIGVDQNRTANGLLITPQYQVTPSTKVREAIENGIIVTFVIQANLYQSKSWWFDNQLESQVHTFAVRYFSLSSQYQLHNIRTRDKQSFITLEQLLTHMGQQTTFQFNREPPADYLQTRLFLDKQALPSTMQLPIVFDADWNLNTDWQTVDLKTSKQP